MLHIVCPNTAIDVRILLEKFNVKSVQRSKDSKNFASGKGVNSAYTNNFLANNCRLHAIVGQLDLDYFQSLRLEYIDQSFFPVDGETRRNVTILDKDGFVTHIQNSGYSITKEDTLKFLNNVFDKVKEDDCLLISGSLPTGFEGQHLHKFISKLNSKNIRLLIDSDLSRLDALTNLKIDYIKPNVDELVEYCKAKEIFNFEKCADSFFKIGVKNIIVSCSDKGAYFFSQNRTLHVGTESKEHGAETVGSGDAFVGAFMAALNANYELEYALRSAAAAGHANTFVEAPGRLTEKYNELFETSIVTKLESKKAFTAIDNIISKQLR